MALGIWVLGCAPPSDVSETDAAAPTEAAPSIPELPFPEPTGRYPVGVTERHWTDSARPDPLTSDPDDLRRVPARIWYPAAKGVDAAAGGASYVPDAQEFEGVGAIEQALHVRTHAVLDASSADGRFPVLVYHHGGGWPRFIGTALGVELASHGYVVVSVGHDGFNQAVRRPDGSSALADAAPFPEEQGDLLNDALRSWDFLDDVHFPQWVADAKFALDQLEELDTGGTLEGKLDLERIGMYGWSFGGATSIEMLVQDERVKAAVDLDGQLFGTASETGTSKPFLLAKASGVSGLPRSDDPDEQARIDAAVEELLGRVAAEENALIAASSGPWHLVEIAGADHGTFSDFPHLTPAAEGGLAPTRSHEILTTLLRAFFGEYLLGEASDVLRDPSAAFSEVSEPRGRGSLAP